MGWDFWNKSGTETPKEAIVDFLKREDGTNPIKDIAMVGTVGYAAYESRENGIVGMVILTGTQRGYHNFGVKIMDESMEPYYYDCPARILDQLTPLPADADETESGAARWRKMCRDKIAKKATAPKLQPGDTVVFDAPLNFGRYGEFNRFTYRKDGRRTIFVTETGLPCSITRWRERTFSVNPQAAANA